MVNTSNGDAVEADKRRGRRITVLTWAFALVVPLISAAGSYLWADLTTSAVVCTTGAGGLDVGIAVFWLLVLAAPISIAVYVRRAGEPIFEHLLPIYLSALLGFVTVFLALQFWWSVHNCMT